MKCLNYIPLYIKYISVYTLYRLLCKKSRNNTDFLREKDVRRRKIGVADKPETENLSVNGGYKCFYYGIREMIYRE